MNNYTFKGKTFILSKVKSLFSFLCLMLVSTSFGQISRTFNSSGSFTIPPGVTSITAQVWGAGENGKNDSNYGGGGGGAFAQSTFNVTPGVVYSINVGNSGYVGENSSVSLSGTPIVRAEGGGQNSFQQGGRASASIGTIRYSGGNGHRSTIYYGGGGGSAGSTGNGNNANNFTGGNGGNGISGNGGNGNSSNPGTGSAPGAGGGEGLFTSGSGGGGRIIITWTCPTTAGTLSGNQNICLVAPNNSTTFTSSLTGGTWSSSNTSIATVNATTGVVTATGTGNAMITYTLASSGCTTRTATRTITVNSTATVTLNKVDQTCAGSNNGTITPSLTGGLTNVRYIQLTQKYINADAWHQVQEIQAFEIFTGTNLALQSNGASATASSTYLNNIGSFGPQRAIDGNFTGYSFWHSNSTNINEFIKVDLASGKNLDYIRIYNRSDCCWSRGQNMLLELLDASNTVVYSTTVDLWGGINGANFVDVNVLDVSWTDTATALNRASLSAGTYTLNYSDVSACTGTNSSVVIGAINTTTAPTISTITHPTCSNANGSLSITNYSTANTYTITPSTGVTNNTGTITAPQGAYTITARNISTGCVSPAVSFTINAQPVTATTPSLGTTTQPTCVLPTGSVVLNNLPSSGTWTITQTGTVGTSYTGTGTSRTISGLAAGTYNFTVSTASTCVSGSSSTLTIVGLETKTWNGSAWSGSTTGAAAPTLDKHIVFTGNYTAANDIEGCSCQVNSAANVTIQTNRYMKIVNQVVVNTSGSLTFENNASLIQITDTPTIPNSGNITYKRTTTPILKTDYVYWSSPVSGFTLGGIQTGTLYYSYNEPANSWAGAGTSTVMTSGIGYIVRGEGTGFDSGTLTINAAFIGPPNNGVVSASSTGAGKTSLLGNPYPSALDADAFLLANNAVLEGTLYFWTHNTAIQLANTADTSFGSGKYSYASDDYATYNFTGGTGTGGQSVSGASQIPDGKIASGVGFFADGAGSGGPVIFNNSMRLNNNAVLSNSQFFKPASGSKTAKTNSVEKNRIWLNLTNNEGAFKQTLLGYITGATNKYDRGYDGVSFDGNSYLDFYSINEDTPLTIQGRALPFAQSDVIPLGYSSKISGNFTISIEKTDGFLESQDVFLEDKMTGYYTNLKKSSYTFSTSEGTFNDRFTINYISKATLGTDDFVSQENGVVIFNKNKEITIQSSEELIAKVQVFDVSGKLIIEKSKLNSNETILRNLSLADQVLIVKVVLENGKTISEKIIY